MLRSGELRGPADQQGDGGQQYQTDGNKPVPGPIARRYARPRRDFKRPRRELLAPVQIGKQPVVERPGFGRWLHSKIFTQQRLHRLETLFERGGPPGLIFGLQGKPQRVFVIRIEAPDRLDQIHRR